MLSTHRPFRSKNINDRGKRDQAWARAHLGDGTVDVRRFHANRGYISAFSIELLHSDVTKLGIPPRLAASPIRTSPTLSRPCQCALPRRAPTTPGVPTATSRSPRSRDRTSFPPWRARRRATASRVESSRFKSIAKSP